MTSSVSSDCERFDALAGEKGAGWSLSRSGAVHRRAWSGSCRTWPPSTRSSTTWCPARWPTRVGVGTLVRVDLHGRRVGGWVVADDVTPPAGVALRPLARVTGWGPAPPIVELAGWAAWRWAGRRSALLRSASAPGAVAGLPPPASGGRLSLSRLDGVEGTEEAFSASDGRSVLRVPPARDLMAVLLAAAERGPTLVVTPSATTATALGGRLRRIGLSVAVVPARLGPGRRRRRRGDRGQGARPGPRVRGLAAVVVLDGHDEAPPAGAGSDMERRGSSPPSGPAEPGCRA